MQRGVQHARIAELEKMQADMLAAVQAMSQVREGGLGERGGCGRERWYTAAIKRKSLCRPCRRCESARLVR